MIADGKPTPVLLEHIDDLPELYQKDLQCWEWEAVCCRLYGLDFQPYKCFRAFFNNGDPVGYGA